MCKVILKLDKFFLKYEGEGRGGEIDPPPLPPGKTTFKKPSLIKVNDIITSVFKNFVPNKSIAYYPS